MKSGVLSSIFFRWPPAALAFQRGILPACRRFLLPLASLLMGAAGLAGCGIGPKWHQEVSLPPLAGPFAARKAMVSDFITSVRTISVTHGAYIKETLESVSVHDISGLIAQGLAANGVPAEARAGFAPRDLRPDEVLVRGAVTAKDRYNNWWLNLPAGLITCCTLLLVGGVLPSPVPWESGAYLNYRVEVIDGEGRVLLQTGDTETIGSYLDFWIWTSDPEKYKEPLVKELTPKVVQALAAALRAARAAAPAPAAPEAPPQKPEAPAAPKEPQLDRQPSEAIQLLAESMVLSKEKKYDDAVDRGEKALKQAESFYQKDDLDLEPFLENLAGLYALRGVQHLSTTDRFKTDIENSKSLYLRAYGLLKRQLGSGHERTVKVRDFITRQFGTDALQSADR